VAAQLLTGKGFKEVYNLKGGIQAWNGYKAFGPQELNMAMLRGDESAAEITVLAYGMEQALGVFYTTLSERTTDTELRGLFSNLAGIEQRHKEMLRALYAEINPAGADLKEFESLVDSKHMEGGFNTEAFMKQNEAHMKTVPDVLTIALMIETQALDLYLRYAKRSTDAHTAEILYKIADEEKAHLAALGRLMEEKA
jgi:rubrerythrin